MKKKGRERQRKGKERKRSERREGRRKEREKEWEKKLISDKFQLACSVYLLVVRFPSGPTLKSRSSFCAPSDIPTNTTSALTPSSASSNYTQDDKFS